jgi:hypothetical protein
MAAKIGRKRIFDHLKRHIGVFIGAQNQFSPSTRLRSAGSFAIARR